MIVGLLYLLAVLAFISFIGWLFLRRPKYTHERFAFTFMNSLFVFTAASIIPMFAGESLLFTAFSAISKLLGFTTPSSSNFFDKALTLIVLVFLGYVGMRLHSQMAGPTTDRKYQLLRRGRETGLITDALAEARALKAKMPLPLATPDSKSAAPIVVEMEQALDWKTRAHRLLLAYSNQFQIDPKIDWIEEVQAYFCTFGKNHLHALVYCPRDIPRSEDLLKLKGECDVQNFKPTKFLIICESGDFDLENLSSNGLPNPEVFTEEKILDELADFETYRRHIVQKFESEVLSSSSGLTLLNTYTALAASSTLGDIPDIEVHIHEWANESSPRHLALLGDYGQGKSTIVTKIAYDYFKIGVGTRIPVIIELRGRNPRNEDIEQIVFPWCKRFGVSPDALIALHSAGRVLLILDGFDEMDYVGDAEVRLAHMQKLWQFSGFRKSKILLTGRPNFFFDTRERERALLVRDELESRPYCEPIRLAPLSTNQASTAIRNFPSETVMGISTALQAKTTSRSLQELLLRPSTLIWAATVWKTLNVEDGSAPVLSASVLRRFIKQANDRQASKGLSTVLLASERQYLTTAVALEIHERATGTNQISVRQLQSIVDSCISVAPDVLREFLEVGESGKGRIEERFQDRRRLVESALTEIRSTGLFIEDVSRPDTFRFAHKSFYEYLVGEALAISLSRDAARETRQYGHREDLRQTTFGGIEASIEGLRNVDLALPSTNPRNGQEVNQFAGETMVNVCLELVKLFDPATKFDLAVRRDIVSVTRRIWIGRRFGIFPSSAFDVSEEGSLASEGSPYFLSFFSIFLEAPFLIRRRYGLAPWVYGAKALGFRPKPVRIPTIFLIVQGILGIERRDQSGFGE